MRRIVAASALLALLVTADAARALPDGGRVTISPGVSYMLYSERANADDGLFYGGGFGLMINRNWGFEGLLGYNSTSHDFDGPEGGVLAGTDTDVRYLGFDVRYHLFPQRRIHPYLSLGWASFHYDPDGTGNQETFQGYEGAIGLMMKLRETETQRVSLRLEARNVYTEFGDPIIPEDQYGSNFMLSGMLQVEFGEDWHKDTDGDGVMDRIDDCPDTAPRVIVDARGCPIDSDEDGIFDGIDECAGTPVGAVVDSLGCPTDSDGDGVFDGIDQCEDTPELAVVDAEGCPIDSDNDGIFDGIDQCPNTPSAVRVDLSGCPTIDSEEERTLYDTGTLALALEFESGEADLRAGASADLRVIANAMRKWPDMRLEIGGHTDDRGAEAANQQLSEERAQTVKDYLVDTFTWISADRLEVVGYGEEKPVADNATEEGRAQNRRVEFVILSGGPQN